MLTAAVSVQAQQPAVSSYNHQEAVRLFNSGDYAAARQRLNSNLKLARQGYEKLQSRRLLLELDLLERRVPEAEGHLKELRLWSHRAMVPVHCNC